MIHGYHVILPMYGVWLPNDPRGAWSDFIWKWELLRYGRPSKTLERRELQELSDAEIRQRDAARKQLQYPPVVLTGLQAQSIGQGFAITVKKSGYTVWACAILPQHTHLVVARHTYKVEQIANLMKGGASKQILKDERHPLQSFAKDGKYPRMWAERRWKVYLDSEEQIETAIRYVEDNPVEEDKPRQHWKFVIPFRGLDPGHITYH